MLAWILVTMQKFGVGAAAVLNAAVGMMDEAPWLGLAVSDDHLESLGRKACSEMRIQRPSDDFAAKRSQDNGKESELLSQMQERDIAHPQLVELGTTCQPCLEFVVTGTKGLARSHNRLSSRKIRKMHLWLPSLPPQQGCDPAVSVVRVAESHLLNEIAQTCLGPPRRRIQPMTVVTRAADASEPAHSVDVEFALRQAGRHLFDDFEDPVSPGALLRR